MDCKTTARATNREQTALSERPDRCGMGAYRAADPPRVKPGGGKRRVAIREVIKRRDVRILSTGCQWRALPKDLAAQKHRA